VSDNKHASVVLGCPSPCRKIPIFGDIKLIVIHWIIVVKRAKANLGLLNNFAILTFLFGYFSVSGTMGISIAIKSSDLLI
jgi:hypothetical protein